MERIIMKIMSSLIMLYALSVFAEPGQRTRYIMVDQFGYRPIDKKIAVIADPLEGRNASDSFIPGAPYEVRNSKTDEVVFTGDPVTWNDGKTHAQSGDRGWWFDFTDLQSEGSYYIYDTENQVASYDFVIDNHVYVDALQAAFKMYYYNRCTMAKEEPYAAACWVDGPSFMGTRQDTAARDVNDKSNPETAKDMSGGWFDAGDFNKYVTFNEEVIHPLLDAYTQNPDAWNDQFNIPESGNGVPDIIDEIIWELDWLKKMQDTTDGGVHIKMGSTVYTLGSPPSTDIAWRFYGPKCSSSSIVTASMFAHAAIVLSEFETLSDYATDLGIRAKQAWDWFNSNPIGENCDTQEIKSGDADRSQSDQEMMAVTAAIYLFALTDDTTYHNYIMQNYSKVEALSWWGPYRLASGDALLYYTQLPNADPTIKNDILSKKISQAKSNQDFYQLYENKDLYRAYMPNSQYHWGSNTVKSHIGNINYDMLYYNLDPDNHDKYLERAGASLHYLHGVNPYNKVYISNMYEYGGDNCVNELYHGWFSDGSKWDNVLKSECGPAPGYVVGGPNKDYGGTEPNISNQPPLKAYKDGNAYSNSWEITEPAIYYQSAYLKLISKFVDENLSSIENEPYETKIILSDIKLFQNYPNPFNPVTKIQFRLAKSLPVIVDVYDRLGQRVITLVHGKQMCAGLHTVIFDGTGLASGLYFYRVQAGTTVSMNKMLLVK
jgi:endoglucanase